tara:strand:- start:2356 stop:3009 length:654 start_codon:yes stop_codon:yes gene_type:complete
MPARKDFTKHQIQNAMDKTKSVRAASRYLNCSYHHLKMWMKRYTDNETGLTLFETHKNPSGKGIPKFISHTPFGRKEPAIIDIVEGRVDASPFDPQKLKYRMIEAGLMLDECCNCGFHERRVIDNKIPLLIHFQDGKNTHWGLDNVKLLCYNCYFLFYGSVFTEKELDQLEGHKETTIKTESEPLQMSDYHIQKIKDIGMYKDDSDDDPYSLVSRKP